MIGVRIKSLRTQKHHTQASLAELLGTDARQIWRWENEESIPSGDVIGKIAVALEASSDYILGLTDDPTPVSMEPSKLSSEEMGALSAWRRGERLEAIKIIAGG